MPVLLGAISLPCRGVNEPMEHAELFPTDSTRTLSEINVVAVKQEEKLRGEALSSTVIGEQQLDNMNAVSMKGLSDAVPNFYMPDYGSRTTASMYVRGIGARMDQPSVGLCVDNVPYLNKNSYDFDLADIAGVEMLRGPQSTLFGRNTMGGLINITTLSPMKWQGWRATLSGGMGNDWRAALGWYHKFNDRTAMSATGNFSYLGGFFRNEYDGKLLDHEASGGIRLKLDWRISPSVYLQNAFAMTLLRQGGYPYESVATGKISYNDDCYYHRFTVNDGLTLRWRQEQFTMTSVTSIQWLDDNMTLDQDFRPEPFFTLTQRQHDLALTEDLVFRGDVGDYHWLAGAFAFYRHLRMEAPVTFKDRGISDLIESNRNESNPEYPISWDSRSFPLNSDFIMPAYGVSLYHQSRYDAGRWHFTAGIRLDWESTGLRYHSYCDTGYEIYHVESNGDRTPFSHNAVNVDDRGSLRHGYFNWMPKVTVLWDCDEARTCNVYASVSKGWKSGGFNTQMFSDVLQQRLMELMGIASAYEVDEIVSYKPEYSWNYEVGSHLTLADGRVNADLSLFYIDCRDQQLTMFPPGMVTGRIMTNAGRTRSIGGEVALDWSVTDALTLSASYGYTNARFRRFNDGRQDYRGKFLPYVPRNTLFLQGVWRVPVRSRWLRAVTTDINMRGTGMIYWNEANTLSQPFYVLLGASVTLDWDKWSLQVWGKNLTATRYDTFYFMSMGNEFLQRGRPLQVGATLRLNLD